MSADESLKQRGKQGSKPVTSYAIDWRDQFVKHLELEYNDAVALLPAEPTEADCRRAMLHAVVATLEDSGADWYEILGLLREGVPLDEGVGKNSGWTSECNVRRITLIDKMIQRTLSIAEAVELERLTAQLRRHVDREELVPMEGARRLHRRLLETNDPGAAKG